jgi:hypothetical protein
MTDHECEPYDDIFPDIDEDECLPTDAWAETYRNGLEDDDWEMIIIEGRVMDILSYPDRHQHTSRDGLALCCQSAPAILLDAHNRVMRPIPKVPKPETQYTWDGEELSPLAEMHRKIKAAQVKM